MKLEATKFRPREEAQDFYLELKQRQMEMEEKTRREQMKLEQQKLAQKQEKLELQRQMFQFQQEKKRDKDLMFYYSSDEHLTGRQRETVLEMKQKIKEKYNLDY